MAWPDSNSIRIAGYVVVALLMLVARRRERRRVGVADGVWPAFWIMTCGLVVAMAVGRAMEAGDLLSSIGRSFADEGGWYGSRRPVQAVVIGTVGAVWIVVVSFALWRAPERRSRYLPVGVMVVTLAAFAAVQIVSLHQAEVVLYRTHVLGVRVGTLVELVLLGLTGLATLWHPPVRSDGGDAVEVGRASNVAR
jgi:hypothetical protein